MSNMVLMDTGALAILVSYFKKTEPSAGNNLYLRLLVNDVEPADTDTIGTYTEAAGGGYLAITIATVDITVSNVAGVVQAMVEPKVFTFSGGLTVNTDSYGAFITDADGTLICASRAALVYTPVAGGSLTITPKFTLS